jgi:hypothetical protein
MRILLFAFLGLFLDAAAAIGCPKGYQFVEIGSRQRVLCRILKTSDGDKISVQILLQLNSKTSTQEILSELRQRRLIPEDVELRGYFSTCILPKTFRQAATEERYDAASRLFLILAKPGVRFRSDFKLRMATR